MAKLGLIGFGKMGQEIARLGERRGHEIMAKFNSQNPLKATTNVDSIDVFIEFTHPEAVVENVRTVAQFEKPLVIGTTGWNEQLHEVEKIVKGTQIGLIYASNFSIGMNLFFKIVENAAGLFDKFEDFDPFIHEVHHKMKEDSPSGTALSLGNILIEKISRKRDILPGTSQGQISSERLHVTSTRTGNVPGTHIVGFESEADSIELKHTARNRSGFALGAVYAAGWIIGKTGIFTMDDFMNDLM